MPERWNYARMQNVIRCTHCGGERYTEAQSTDADTVDIDGRRISDFIRYLNARGCWHSWCRACEREANANRPRRERRAATIGTARAARTVSANTARKFGVELELIFPGGVTRERVMGALRDAGLPSTWRCKSDGSLNGGNGLEVVSPPLQGEAGFDALRTACRVLNRLGAKPNRSCGLHVHHDASDLTIAEIKMVARDWQSNQATIDGLVSPSRRENNAYYCQHLTSSEVARVEACGHTRDLRNVGIQRYKTLNLMSYGRHGTLEIRQHQGTCDFEKIRSWALLGQAIIDRARTGSPMGSPGSVRGMLDRLGEMLDATAKTYIIGRAVEFGYATV